MNTKLPGIKKVEYCFSNRIRVIPEQIFQEGDQVEVDGAFIEIPISGLASVEMIDSIENEQVIYQTKLTFFTQCPPFPSPLKRCYRITDVQGNQFLIGIAKSPFPVSSGTDSNPSSPAGKRGKETVVTWKSTVPMLHIKK